MAEIQAERQRQIDVEGFAPAFDDAFHPGGALLKAGIVYYLSAQGCALMVPGAKTPIGWPWSPEWWKPKGKRHDLVRAGALFLAERERLQRASRPTGMHRPADPSYIDQWIDFSIAALNEMGPPPAVERTSMVPK